MYSHWVAKSQGYVRVEVNGQQLEQCINLLVNQGFILWSIRPMSTNKIQFNLSVHDFFRIRPFLKQTGCKLHIKKRYGLPFLLSKLKDRQGFIYGFIGCLVGIYLLSSLIWSVEIEGNEQISREEIINAARNQGIYPLQWKFRLDNPEHMSEELIKQLNNTSWVGVEIKGTRIHIQIVESRLAEKRPLDSPRHLISTSDGVITKIMVDKGRSLVSVNQRVKKGEILISGILGDEEVQEVVVANGQVRALVWHEYKIQVALERKYKTYLGGNKERLYIVLGKRALQISGYGQIKFEDYELDSKRNIFKWRDRSISLGWIREKVMEVQHESRMISNEEAVEMGLQQAREDIELKFDADAVIIDENILHENAERGKVYMKVLFEVDQQITIEQPIVQGD